MNSDHIRALDIGPNAPPTTLRTMAGYPGTPLATKIGIKPGHTLFLDAAPADLDLGDLAGVHVVRRLPRRADITLSFHTTLAGLERRLPQLFDRTRPPGWSGSAGRSCWHRRRSA